MAGNHQLVGIEKPRTEPHQGIILKYLLATDTPIDVYTRAGIYLARLAALPDRDLTLSCINQFELEFGMAKSANRTSMLKKPARHPIS